MASFAHLAVRTAYSLRDGVIRPKELAFTVAARDMGAVGIADRDGLYGAVRVAQACHEAEVRPIFGVDLGLAPQTRPGWTATRGGRARPPGTARPRSGPAWLEDDAPRVILLARTARGYAALCRLTSAAHLESERGTARASWAQLERTLGEVCGELFVLLGDDAPTARLLDAGRVDAAVAEARRWCELTGPENLLVGVTHHRAAGDDARARSRFALADRLGLRAVAHQDPRYLDPGDAAMADLVDAIRAQVPLDPRHSRRRNAEGYVKSPEEMARVFGERPDALTATGWVAERCEVDLGLGRLRVPDLAGAGGANAASAELAARTLAGLADRFSTITSAHRERLDHELSMLDQLGLAPYFLTVAEIVDRIRDKGVMVACRGSAAGSLVCYCLRISDVDPVRHDLCFERFANPHRDELPDIDLDVESTRREDIYRDLLATYGEERVVCVAMVETFKARMAIREVGKALGLPPAEIDHIATAFPHIRARDVRSALEVLPELAGRGLDRPDLAQLFDLVERLDGLPRHLALHPSGVLLGHGPAEGHAERDELVALRDLLPVERSAQGFVMAQLDKDDVEALGLCKLDVLSVRMLSAMRHAVDEAARVRGVDIDLDTLDDADPATYELIRSTRTVGMFQIESPGQRELLGRFQPEHVGDLVVDISLFRPGPVKSDMVEPFLLQRLGQAEPIPSHPLLAAALEETFGVIVYHEQVMRCVAALTGCDLGIADLVRRRLADAAEVPTIREWVLAGAAERGVPEAVATSTWAALEQFASFGFCKAHAAAFAVPTFRSAWLKAHHAPELIAGLLTHDPGMYPRRLILADARQLGICVLPLDINRSDRDYRVERVPAAQAYARLGIADDGDLPAGWRRDSHSRLIPPSGIDLGAAPATDAGATQERFGIRPALGDVAGIDDRMIEALLVGRPFCDLDDLRQRGGLSQPVAEALAYAGALDALGQTGSNRRDILLEVTERWSGAGRRRARSERSDAPPRQLDLLGPGEAPGLASYRPAERVRAELEVLGLDVSRHVISFYEKLIDLLGVTRAADLLSCPDRSRVRVAGAKVATQTPPVKSGQRVIFLSLDDSTGISDTAFFEAVHDRCAHTVLHNWLLVAEGTLRRRGRRGVGIVADRTWDLRVLMHAWRDGRLEAALASQGDQRAVGATARAPAGAAPPRGLWHASGGSAGRR